MILGGGAPSRELVDFLAEKYKGTNVVVYTKGAFVAVRFPELYFNAGSVGLEKQKKERLKPISEAVIRFGGEFDLLVEGHADVTVSKSRGSDNWDVAYHRAKGVANAMSDLKVGKKGMGIISRGDGLAQGNVGDRRVELVFSPKREVADTTSEPHGRQVEASRELRLAANAPAPVPKPPTPKPPTPKPPTPKPPTPERVDKPTPKAPVSPPKDIPKETSKTEVQVSSSTTSTGKNRMVISESGGKGSPAPAPKQGDKPSPLPPLPPLPGAAPRQGDKPSPLPPLPPPTSAAPKQGDKLSPLPPLPSPTDAAPKQGDKPSPLPPLPPPTSAAPKQGDKLSPLPPPTSAADEADDVVELPVFRSRQ